MPKFTVSVEMDIDADDTQHAAALAYHLLATNCPPLYYWVRSKTGINTDVLLDEDAMRAFMEVQQELPQDSFRESCD